MVLKLCQNVLLRELIFLKRNLRAVCLYTLVLCSRAMSVVSLKAVHAGCLLSVLF